MTDDLKAGLLQGTLDMLILKALSLGPLHGYGVIQRIGQMSGQMLAVEQGSLYPALYRIEQRGWVTSEWGINETGRRAKFYTLTREGASQLTVEEASWDRLALAIAKIRQATGATLRGRSGPGTRGAPRGRGAGGCATSSSSPRSRSPFRCSSARG